MDTMASIKQTFFQECDEQLAELETGLLSMEEGDHDSETINAVFRAVHSVKGGAGAFMLTELVRFAHVFEGALDHMRAGRMLPTPDILKTMLRAADVLADLVKAARDGSAIDEPRRDAIAEEIAAMAAACVPASAAPGPAPNAGGPVDDEADEFGFVPLKVELSDFDDLFDLPPTTTRYRVTFAPRPELYAKANETALLIRELRRVGKLDITCHAGNLPLLADIDPEGAYFSWTIDVDTEQSEAAIREVFEFAEWDCDLSVEASPVAAALPALDEAPVPDVSGSLALPGVDMAISAAATTDLHAPANDLSATSDATRADKANADKAATPAQATIRVDLDRVDRLIDLVGELVINQAMLAQRVIEAGVARASAVTVGLDELEQLTREIQDSVMAIRAQPVKSVFQRMPRLVREVAAMTGKTVRLVMEGEGTEVDKTVIERLADPLTHMIRNAIDHGLESSEKRLAAGKPEEGQVRLCALHRSGRIVIEVSDDGGGIDRARVKAIAVEKGLIAPDVTLSDEETDNLIFLPGFSTAAVVSDISGRGVGMDVVKRSIQALGGRISISSRPGFGSTFTMSLPLTLAVLDGMVVTVGDQTLVVPLTAIVETLQPKPGTVHGFGGDARVVAIRDSFIPLVDVGKVLAFRTDLGDPATGIVILVEAEGGTRSALLVDAIQGQRQVVIKSLEANYGHVPGIAAATILGDGRVALILDVDAVVADASRSAIARPALLAAG